MIKYLLISLFSVLHYFAFVCSKNKDVITDDINRISNKYGISDLPFFLRFGYILFENRYYRVAFYHRLQNGLVKRILSLYLPGDRYFNINTNCILGGGIYPEHASSTYINAQKIGKDLSIRNNVTIGNKTDGQNDKVPSIGDNVYIGANSIIIGNISVGNNAVIGAGSVVVKDVPDNAIVAGNPAKVIKMI